LCLAQIVEILQSASVSQQQQQQQQQQIPGASITPLMSAGMSFAPSTIPAAADLSFAHVARHWETAWSRLCIML
jgi:hypothetical protein